MFLLMKKIVTINNKRTLFNIYQNVNFHVNKTVNVANGLTNHKDTAITNSITGLVKSAGFIKEDYYLSYLALNGETFTSAINNEYLIDTKEVVDATNKISVTKDSDYYLYAFLSYIVTI